MLCRSAWAAALESASASLPRASLFRRVVPSNSQPPLLELRTLVSTGPLQPARSTRPVSTPRQLCNRRRKQPSQQPARQIPPSPRPPPSPSIPRAASLYRSQPAVCPKASKVKPTAQTFQLPAELSLIAGPSPAPFQEESPSARVAT